jgi:hypothetical protein
MVVIQILLLGLYVISLVGSIVFFVPRYAELKGEAQMRIIRNRLVKSQSLGVAWTFRHNALMFGFVAIVCLFPVINSVIAYTLLKYSLKG